MDGNQQAMFSVAAAVGAVLFTLATTSLLNAGFGRGEELKGTGLQALRRTNYFIALRRTMGRLWKD